MPATPAMARGMLFSWCGFLIGAVPGIAADSMPPPPPPRVFSPPPPLPTPVLPLTLATLQLTLAGLQSPTPAVPPREPSLSPADVEDAHNGWQGFTTQHRIKHGIPLTNDLEEEEAHERKWYEPAYAEYHMVYEPPWHYIVLLVMYVLPVVAVLVYARRSPWLGSLVDQACLIPTSYRSRASIHYKGEGPASRSMV
jgi:hypothetical protein